MKKPFFIFLCAVMNSSIVLSMFPLKETWHKVQRTVVPVVVRNKGKAVAGAYAVYSAGWYCGVAALTYQAKQLNDENRSLKVRHDAMREDHDKALLRVKVLEREYAALKTNQASLEERLDAIEKSRSEHKE